MSRTLLKSITYQVAAFMLILNVSLAQVQQFRFRHVAHARDVGQIMRRAVLEDSAGFLWMAAGDRIYRFDGRDLRPFSLAKEDTNLSRTAIIRDSSMAADGTIWIGTRCGLARLSPDKNSIRLVSDSCPAFADELNLVVTTLAIGPEGKIWFAGGNRLFCFDPVANTVRGLGLTNRSWGSPFKLQFSDEGAMWIFFRNGRIGLRETTTGEFHCYDLTTFANAPKDRLSISATLIETDNRALVGTRKGLFEVKLVEKSIRRITAQNPAVDFRGGRAARALSYVDDKKKLWIGTIREGLFLLDLETGKSTQLRSRADQPTGLLSDHIYSTKVDRSGALWIGSAAGYSVLDPVEAFSFMSFADIDKHEIRRGLPGVAFDTLGRWWLSLPDETTTVLDGEFRSMREIRLDVEFDKKKGGRHFLLPGKNGDMWIASSRVGLTHAAKDFSLRTYTATKDGNRGPRSDFIHALGWEKDGNLLIAHELGIDRLNVSTDRFETVSLPEFTRKDRLAFLEYTIKHVALGLDGIAYVSSATDRLFRISPGSREAVEMPLSPGSADSEIPDHITSLIPEGNGTIWITAYNGVFKWEPETGVAVYQEELGRFAKLGRKGAVKDLEGALWFPIGSSDLIKFDPSTETIREFVPEATVGPTSGLESQHTTGPDGRVFISTRYGILHFQPKELSVPLPPAVPVITQLDMLGETQWDGRESVGPTEIMVKESDNFLTMHFVSPNNYGHDKITYSYSLSELRPDWVPLGVRRAIDFSRLPAGKFVFVVKATNEHTGKSSLSAPLTLVVEPPLLSRPLTRAFLALLAVLVVALIGFLRTRSIRQHADRLQTEIERRGAAESALAESEARLSTAFASMPCATWVRSKTGVVELASPRFVETWGNIVGSKGPTESMPSIYADHWHLDHTTALTGATVQETLDFKNAEGECRVIHVVSPIYVDGNVVGTVGVDIDISALRRSEAEKGELERQLRHTQKLEAVGKLAGGVAHDFNNILTAITGHAEMIRIGLEDGDPGESIESDLEGVLSSSNRAARLTQQLLTFSKKDLVIPETFDPGPILDDMRSMLSRLLRENIELSMHRDAQVGAIHADRGQFEQIVMNLVVNSSDAMPQGGILRISMTSARIPSDTNDLGIPAIRIQVSDTGTGMNDEIAQRVFEPYFTTKPVGEGTGLGLSTVHGIVERLQGTIALRTEEGKGTAIDIVLPCVDTPIPKPELAPLEETSSGSYLGDETIVVCEDNQQVRTLTCRILELSGYNTIETPTPADAIRLFNNTDDPPRLLLTDVIMPGMDGPQLATELLHDFPNLKVLFMSGYTSDVMLESRLPIPGASFLRKPFTASRLAKRVRALLDADEQHIPIP